MGPLTDQCGYLCEDAGFGRDNITFFPSGESDGEENCDVLQHKHVT